MRATTKFNDILPDGEIINLTIEVSDGGISVLEVNLSREDVRELFRVLHIDTKSLDERQIQEALQSVVRTLKEHGEQSIDMSTVNDGVMSIAI